MLSHLSIRNIVLIERLDLEFSKGLSVLTGETGAGKSILLDSLLRLVVVVTVPLFAKDRMKGA
jgi:DNA repair ATPase RecN